MLRIKRGDNERLKAVENADSYLTFAGGLRFMAKKDITDADIAAVIDKSTGAGITITVAGGPSTAAEAQIVINSADTKSLPNRETKLTCELIDSNNHTLWTDTIVVDPEVILA